ncbi:MAG: helix-turn-helix domain-containing protein [Pseudonocardia sp.]
MRADERVRQVRLLREQGYTPKQVAHSLGIGSAEATRLVRAAAALAKAEAPEPALIGCWISPTWSTDLSLGEHPDWPLHEDPTAGTDGLAAVLVARRHRHDKVSVCGYLADVYCLGVKDALGPQLMDEFGPRGLNGFRRGFFSGYHGDPLEAPIDLAREVVFGSIAYARGLGFEPHPDFADAQAHLGPWSGPSSITFGKQSKPFYVSGPNDNPRAVIRTLERTVGTGNFDFLTTIIAD